MANLITIDQLLESVDLDFEPRFVTKQKDGLVMIWSARPKILTATSSWENDFCERLNGSFLKLSEFDGKDWTECIYEVPRKTDEYEQNLEKTRPADSDLVYRVNLPRKDKPVVKIEKLNLLNDSALLWGKKINELVAAVNELKGAKND